MMEKVSNINDIPKRLREVIKVLGLSLKKAAELCNIPYRSLQDYIYGSRKPRIDALVKISNSLRVSLDWLLTGKGSMFLGEVTFDEKWRAITSDISHRLRILRTRLGMDQSEFAEKIGISLNEYIRYEAGEPMSLHRVYLIKEAFPSVNLNWLIMGKGSIFTEKGDIQVLPLSGQLLEAKESAVLNDYVVIPYYKETLVSAGQGIFPYEFPSEPLVIPKEYLRKFFGLTSFKGLSLVPVSGRSMEMTIPDKSLAVVRDWRLDGGFFDGGVYVLVVDDLLYVKRVYFDKENEKLYLVSDNQNVPRIEMKWDDKVHIIGRVVGCISFVEVG